MIVNIMILSQAIILIDIKKFQHCPSLPESSCIFTLCACTRGKVIGSIRLSSVITKIARLEIQASESQLYW